MGALCWPGGNFASGYDWLDGISDRDRRPPRKNPAWTGVEHNDFGTEAPDRHRAPRVLRPAGKRHGATKPLGGLHGLAHGDAFGVALFKVPVN